MIRRATFGLEHWSELSETERHTVGRDMALTINAESNAQARYRDILAAKSVAESAEIRAALTASARATPYVLRELGE